MSKNFELTTQAVVHINETDEAQFVMTVDNRGNCKITTPRGTNIRVIPGRKGKFFKDLHSAYKIAAENVETYDTIYEEGVDWDEEEEEEED